MGFGISILNWPRKDNLRDEQMMGLYEYYAKEKRTLFLRGELSHEAVVFADYIYGLAEMSADPIKIIIYSSGGVADVCFAIIDAMKHVRTPVWTIGQYAASAAALILASGQKEHRYIQSRAIVTLHYGAEYIQSLFPGQVFVTDLHDARKRLENLERLREEFIDLLHEFGCQKSKEDLIKVFDQERDIHLTNIKTPPFHQAIEWGLADYIYSGGVI